MCNVPKQPVDRLHLEQYKAPTLLAHKYLQLYKEYLLFLVLA